MNRKDRRAAEAKERAERPKSDGPPAPPVVEIDGTRYIAAILFVGGAERRDFLASVSRVPDGDWEVRYRFRYYVSNDPWDRRDRKNFYNLKARTSKSEDDLVADIRALGEFLVARGFNDHLDILEVRTSDPEYIFAALQNKPWAHVKRVEDMPS